MRPAPFGHAVVVLTGIQAAGKSTVAQALAERLPRSAHVRGDVFRRMVVAGRADPTPNPSAEAVRQLRLRYRLAAEVAEGYFRAGFTTVLQDVVLGEHLVELTRLIRVRPLLVVVLVPRPEVVAARDAARAATRGKVAYGAWTIRQLDDGLRRGTPRIGFWLDSSDQTPDETVDEILSRGWTEGWIA